MLPPVLKMAEPKVGLWSDSGLRVGSTLLPFHQNQTATNQAGFLQHDWFWNAKRERERTREFVDSCVCVCVCVCEREREREREREITIPHNMFHPNPIFFFFFLSVPALGSGPTTFTKRSPPRSSHTHQFLHSRFLSLSRSLSLSVLNLSMCPLTPLLPSL